MVSKFVTYSGRTLYYGLTEDVKPIDAPNGACYTDIETGDEYWFDKENDGWYAPDGSFIPNPHEDEEGDEDMFVNYSKNADEEFVCDKTYSEIMSAINSGKNVIAVFNNPTANPEKMFLPLTQVGFVSGDTIRAVMFSTSFLGLTSEKAMLNIIMHSEDDMIMTGSVQLQVADV